MPPKRKPPKKRVYTGLEKKKAQVGKKNWNKVVSLLHSNALLLGNGKGKPKPASTNAFSVDRVAKLTGVPRNIVINIAKYTGHADLKKYSMQAKKDLARKPLIEHYQNTPASSKRVSYKKIAELVGINRAIVANIAKELGIAGQYMGVRKKPPKPKKPLDKNTLNKQVVEWNRLQK